MVRDRLHEFQTRVRDDFEEVSLGPPRSPMPDAFQERTMQVRSLLEELRIDIGDLQRQQEHVLSLTVVTPDHKRELEGCIGRIRQKTQQLRPQLQLVEDDFRRFERDPQNRSSTEIRIRRNQLDMLRAKMSNVVSAFNDSQIQYKERVSKRVKRELQLAGEDVSEPEVQRMLDSQSSQVFYREVSPLSVAGRVALADASARHEEILELERSLALLNEMFTDVYDLVHTQGEMVENIERQVDGAVVHVQQASTNTKQAVVYKKSAMRKKIICIIIVIVLILILVVAAIVLGVVLSGRK